MGVMRAVCDRLLVVGLLLTADSCLAAVYMWLCALAAWNRRACRLARRRRRQKEQGALRIQGAVMTAGICALVMASGVRLAGHVGAQQRSDVGTQIDSWPGPLDLCPLRETLYLCFCAGALSWTWLLTGSARSRNRASRVYFGDIQRLFYSCFDLHADSDSDDDAESGDYAQGNSGDI